ncbi:hypothetical protein FA13DRAFT_1715607 [Coprinellus micaceus]|uniref:Uncharacterized protein n=1 Tax=Coprinellus micaceus TaxID=71717 RepID=A0A4Y7SN78_COPMI|nr:hypothetical protein FA13DRAFT_1715607 [Coprinellus micaceus]
MLLHLKAIAVTLFASIALAKAFSATRNYEDFELDARSHIDVALSSLTTRALIGELNDRLERRGKGSAAERAREEAIARCKKILANAAGKTIHPNAVYPLEECLRKLFDLEGAMPVANWNVGPSPSSFPSYRRVCCKGQGWREKVNASSDPRLFIIYNYNPPTPHPR